MIILARNIVSSKLKLSESFNGSFALFKIISYDLNVRECYMNPFIWMQPGKDPFTYILFHVIDGFKFNNNPVPIHCALVICAPAANA